MKAGHNTITPFNVKVMSKYKVLSKLERGVIKKRSYWTQFQCGILPLEIETDRWQHKDIEEICKAYENNDIEDERHFVIKCSLYVNEGELPIRNVRHSVSPFHQMNNEKSKIVMSKE